MCKEIEYDEGWESLHQKRYIRKYEKVCKKCYGTGITSYGNTSRYFGGFGGSAICYDVCNMCWGTGTTDRIGVNLKELILENINLKKELTNRTIKE